jgi:hypothetical protein
MNLYVDLDGVLADFDQHHETVFGFRSCKIADNVDWEAVRRIEGFYLNIPPMADIALLWGRIARYAPIVLTGVPWSITEAPENKKAWVRKNLGEHVEVICCRSRSKSDFCQSGDVLIDDWEKYKDLWLARGGRWITHTSAAETVRALNDMGL